MARFPFTFAPLYRPFAVLFGVLPAAAHVQVDDTMLAARGLWRYIRHPNYVGDDHAAHRRIGCADH